MKKLTERLKHATPYLRVATLISRETIYDLMMETDLDTVYILRAVMLLGMEASEHGGYYPAANPNQMLAQKMDTMVKFRPASMDMELENMLDLKHFRKYVTTGMAILGIY